MDRRIAGILISLSVSLPLLIYNNAVDNFVPLLSGRLLYIEYFGTTPDFIMELVPGFYWLGTIISQITGVSPHDLIFYPIQAFATIFLVYALIRRVSRDDIVAGLITLTVALTAGNQLLYYEHGMGRIFIIGLLFSLVVYLYNPSRRTTILVMIFSIPVILISYNNAARIVLLLGCLTILLLIKRLGDLPVDSPVGAGGTMTIMALAAVPIFLSFWFYRTFLPSLAGAAGARTAFDFFSLNTLGRGGSSPLLSELSVTTPSIVTYSGILKYLILCSFLVLLTILALKDVYRQRPISPEQLLVFSLICGSGVYFIMRLIIGSVEFAELFYPGIIALAYLFYRADDEAKQTVIYGSLVVLVVISAAGPVALMAAGDIERDSGRYEYVEPAAFWWDEYGTGEATTDIRTQHVFASRLAEPRFESGERDAVHQIAYSETNALTTDGYPANILGYSEEPAQGEYVVINYRLSYVGFRGWFQMRPWSHFESEINSNTGYHSVYNTGGIEIQKINEEQ